MPPQIAANFKNLIKKEDEEDLGIVRTMGLYAIKKYSNLYKERNQLYYHLLSAMVQDENPFRTKKINEKQKKTHETMILEK